MYEIRSIIGHTITFCEEDEFDNTLAYYGEDRDGCILKPVPEFALCEGRHEMPCSDAIFGRIDDPTDIAALYRAAMDKVINYTSIVVYVTGLSVALVAIINACHDRGINLCLRHFDRNTGKYYDQWVH